jgi:hypothetical protein
MNPSHVDLTGLQAYAVNNDNSKAGIGIVNNAFEVK